MTHQAQIDLRPIEEIRAEIICFLKEFDQIAKDFETDQILQMDETATQFDMPREQRIDFVEAKSINTAHWAL